jgi:hypothetical protein
MIVNRGAHRFKILLQLKSTDKLSDGTVYTRNKIETYDPSPPGDRGSLINVLVEKDKGGR